MNIALIALRLLLLDLDKAYHEHMGQKNDALIGFATDATEAMYMKMARELVREKEVDGLATHSQGKC